MHTCMNDEAFLKEAFLYHLKVGFAVVALELSVG